MARPGALAAAAAAAAALLALAAAGPLGPLPNTTLTSTDLGLRDDEACTVGDVVYAAGEEVPGAGACERCRCARGAVACARAACEPRPGCKALHRPDHCCPTYQCECEQEGRVYGNGEKLVDPADPCRVCYCQGGEVVCRRIACFVRADCRPRAVPGRCCPDYDNCPLRGVTSIPGLSTSMSTIEEMSSPAPTPPRESVKQEITIKEITPVSEIPAAAGGAGGTALDVPDYPSSRAPLIVREATSERAPPPAARPAPPLLIQVHQSSEEDQPPSEVPSSETKTSTTNDSPPSKISLSTQDSINSDIYPSADTSATSKVPPSPSSAATGAPVVEEDDPALFEHNPAFPPLPDDLSVLSNHEDELLPEPADAEHPAEADTPEPPAAPRVRASPPPDLELATEPAPATSPTPAPSPTLAPPVTTAAPTEAADTSAPPSTGVFESVTGTKEGPSTSSTRLPERTESSTRMESTSKVNDMTAPVSTRDYNVPTDVPLSTEIVQNILSTDKTKVRDSPMLNLRSAIPTEILNMPSSVPEEITGELDEASEGAPAPVATTAEPSTAEPRDVETTVKQIEKSTAPPGTAAQPRPSTPPPPARAHNSTIVTEITAQTEFSSLPIETSDQNPRENSETFEKEKQYESTPEASTPGFGTTKPSMPIETEVITVYNSAPTNTESHLSENIETTEFVITSFGSSESSTDAVEVIKVSAEPAPPPHADHDHKSSVLTDLIDLVGDVAAIGAPSAAPAAPAAVVAAADSEELVPVNAGYKSKNSNWNLNSITEVPFKSKGPSGGGKQKVVEIEEDGGGIADPAPPGDRAEPTTRRPLIDRVADAAPAADRADTEDIEIITRSYVPTINRRPTKVIMKKNNEKPLKANETAEAEMTTAAPATASASTSNPAADTSAAPPPSAAPAAASSAAPVVPSSAAAPAASAVPAFSTASTPVSSTDH